MMRRLALAAMLLTGAAGAAAQDLRVDLSNHLITISTGFDGADVVLFGSRLGEGDVAVIVRGPVKPIAVRRTERMMGVWLNASAERFDQAPSFYTVAATGPLDAIATPETRAVHEIGIDHVRLSPPGAGGPAPVFREAFIRLKREQGLYVAEPLAISALGPALFRVTLSFPSNVPTGQYSVEALLLRDGRVAAAQTTPLVVSKAGVGASVSAFARERAPVYALLAVLCAAAAGWLVDRLLRRS